MNVEQIGKRYVNKNKRYVQIRLFLLVYSRKMEKTEKNVNVNVGK